MVSRRALILNLGPQITQQVLSLKAGQTSPAIRFRKTSWVIFRVNKILKTYEELEPTIIDILAEAALNQVLYGIRERAAIESPYLTKTRAKVPLPGQEQAPAKPEKPGLRGADVNLVPKESPAVPSAPTPDAPAISLPAPEDKPPDLAPPTGTK